MGSRRSLRPINTGSPDRTSHGLMPRQQWPGLRPRRPSSYGAGFERLSSCAGHVMGSGTGVTGVRGSAGWWAVASGELLAAGGSHAIPKRHLSLVLPAPIPRRSLPVAMYRHRDIRMMIPLKFHRGGTTTRISARDSASLLISSDTCSRRTSLPRPVMKPGRPAPSNMLHSCTRAQAYPTCLYGSSASGL